ncbi:MAG: diaminopimelate decarboxylase, partial [Elusimicrobia bacterium]|nr:diaminopimelate decarboxylase [Elusimicrobiota bacterium]
MPRTLRIGGCASVDLARRYGTPLYVLNEEVIRRRCRDYKEAFCRYYPQSAT